MYLPGSSCYHLLPTQPWVHVLISFNFSGLPYEITLGASLCQPAQHWICAILRVGKVVTWVFVSLSHLQPWRFWVSLRWSQELYVSFRVLWMVELPRQGWESWCNEGGLWKHICVILLMPSFHARNPQSGTNKYPRIKHTWTLMWTWEVQTHQTQLSHVEHSEEGDWQEVTWG